MEHEANELRTLIEVDIRQLTLLLAGVGDGAATVRPEPDVWSVKEVLAHLSEVTRSRFFGLGEVLRDPEHVLAPCAACHMPEKLAAIVTTCGTVAALVTRCRTDLEDVANLVAVVPAERLGATAKRRGESGLVEVSLYPWVRYVFAEHFDEHLSQIRGIRDQVRA